MSESLVCTRPPSTGATIDEDRTHACSYAALLIASSYLQIEESKPGKLSIGAAGAFEYLNLPGRKDIKLAIRGMEHNA